MTLLFPPLYSHAHWISATLAFYVLAKVCEDLDSQIYFHLGVSGHAIKHIAAAIAVVPIVFMLTIRSPLHRQ
jgi:hypothetical protein